VNAGKDKNSCQLMAENATSWFQEDHSWRKATVRGEKEDWLFLDILKPCSSLPLGTS